jgi:hypothetical protein
MGKSKCIAWAALWRRLFMAHLARTLPFDLDRLRNRYQKELRPNLGNPAREDLTLQLWIESIQEERNE